MAWPRGDPGPTQKFTAQERADAVALAERVGVRAAAREVGCSEPSLYAWRKAARSNGHAPAPRPVSGPQRPPSGPSTVEARAACCGNRVPVLTPATRKTAIGRANRMEALELHFVVSPACRPRLRSRVRRRAVAAR